MNYSGLVIVYLIWVCLWLYEGIVKTHRLLFIECDAVQAVFAKQRCPNVLTAPTRYYLFHSVEMHTAGFN